ncbi:MFS transporter [Mycoplasmatota bacterium]|nr:MFS transporter [Mycoplasmatota bacterium]
MSKNAFKMLLLSLLIGVTIYLEKPILPEILRLHSIDLSWSGALFAVFGFSVMLFAPFLGDVGDKKGRKLVLIISVLGMAVGQLIFGLSSAISGMLISRFIFGSFFSGIAVNFMAYFNDNYMGSEKSRMISYNLAIMAFGLALGSLFGGYLSGVINTINIYFLQSILFVIIAFVVFFIYPKEYIRIDVKRNYVFNMYQNIKRVKLSGLLPGMIVTMVFSIGIYIVLNFLEFYLSSKNFSLGQIGLYVFSISLVGVLGNIFITPTLLRRFDEKIYLVVILIVSGISLMITSYHHEIGLYVFMFVFGLVSMMFKPITTQIISKNAEDEQGLALGVRETLIHFGMMVGSITGGYLFSSEPTSIFFASSLIMFVCAIGFGSLKYLETRNK